VAAQNATEKDKAMAQAFSFLFVDKLPKRRSSGRAPMTGRAPFEDQRQAGPES
jgi:hypothetical protein